MCSPVLCSFSAAFLGHREAIQGNGREGAEVGASLGRANEAHRGLAVAVRDLGAAGERIAARVAEVMQEREARERVERHRPRDRGDDYGL